MPQVFSLDKLASEKRLSRVPEFAWHSSLKGTHD